MHVSPTADCRRKNGYQRVCISSIDYVSHIFCEQLAISFYRYLQTETIIEPCLLKFNPLLILRAAHHRYVL